MKSELKHFHWRRYDWEYRLRNVGVKATDDLDLALVLVDGRVSLGTLMTQRWFRNRHWTARQRVQTISYNLQYYKCEHRAKYLLIVAVLCGADKSPIKYIDIWWYIRTRNEEKWSHVIVGYTIKPTVNRYLMTPSCFFCGEIPLVTKESPREGPLMQSFNVSLLLAWTSR